MLPVKWGISLLLVAATLAAPASASAPTLNGLQRQITQLRTALVAGQKATDQTVGTNRDWMVCYHAQDLDNVNIVWHVLNVDLAYQGFTAQPDLPRFDDQGACARIGQQRSR